MQGDKNTEKYKSLEPRNNSLSNHNDASSCEDSCLRIGKHPKRYHKENAFKIGYLSRYIGYKGKLFKVISY